MSSDSYIDEKKGNTTVAPLQNAITFLKSIMNKLITLMIIVFIGVTTLYGAKVSQSNILPTDTNCYPYEDNEPDIKYIPININVTKVEDEMKSQKIYFPYNLNKKNFILDSLRKMKSGKNVSSLTMYMVMVLIDLFSFNYFLMSSLFTAFNQVLPESVILLLGPIILIFTLFFSLMINQFYLIYAWFKNMSWLFKKNINHGEGESITLFGDFFNYFLCIILVFLFVILFFIGFGTFFPVLSIVALFSALVCVVSFNGLMKIDGIDSKVTLLSIFKDVLKYKKGIIMILISLLVITTAMSSFPPMISGVLIIVMLLFIFGIIPNNLYKSSIPDDLSKLASYETAEKKCTEKIPEPVKKGWFGLWGGNTHSQTGGFVNHLKSFGQQLGGGKKSRNKK